MKWKLLIMFLIVLVIGFGGFIIYDKVLKNEEEQEVNSNKVTHNYDFLVHDAYTHKIVGVDSTGKVVEIMDEIDDGANSFYLDGDILYYIDKAPMAACGEKHNLYKLDINNPKEIQNMNIELEMCGNGFSVVNDNIYYFSKENNKYVAVTYNIKEEKKKTNELALNYIDINDFSSGTIAYIDDHNNIADNAYNYSYNFVNNQLLKLEKYSANSYTADEYELRENKGNRILFLNKNEYCVYDTDNNKELYCIDVKKYDLFNENVWHQGTATLKDDSIILLADNVIYEYKNSNSYDVIYELTEEDKKSNHAGVLYFGDKLVLILAKEKGYLTYDYTYYDLTNNGNKLSLPNVMENGLLYFVR